MIKKRVIEGSAAFEKLLQKMEKQGKTTAETTDSLATAQALSVNGDPEGPALAIEILQAMTDPTRTALDPDILQKMEPTKILGIHLGAAMTVEKCPFGRSMVGVDISETDPQILVDRSFAEWKTAQTKRCTVIVFKASDPILIYRDVQWEDAPVQLPSGENRDFYGRHYISSAEVVSLPTQQTFDMHTESDSEKFIRPRLTHPRQMDLSDPLISYVKLRRRDRKAPQQPIDKLE